MWGLRLVGWLLGWYRSLRSREALVEGIKQDLYRHDSLFFPPSRTSTRPGPYRRHLLSHIPPTRILTATFINDYFRRPSFFLSAFTPTPHPIHPHHPGLLLTFRATRWSRLRYASFCISSEYVHFVFLYLHETMDDFAITTIKRGMMGRRWSMP